MFCLSGSNMNQRAIFSRVDPIRLYTDEYYIVHIYIYIIYTCESNVEYLQCSTMKYVRLQFDGMEWSIDLSI